MLTKAQIIERIQDHNQTAGRTWLEIFSDGQLRRYLEHLLLAQQPRDGRSRWIRDGEVPAMIGLRPDA